MLVVLVLVAGEPSVALDEPLEGEICGRTTWSGLTDPPLTPEFEDGAEETDFAKVVVVECAAFVIPRLLSDDVLTVEGSEEKALMAMREIARIRIAPFPAAFPERSLLRDTTSCSLCALIRAAEEGTDLDRGALVLDMEEPPA